MRGKVSIWLCDMPRPPPTVTLKPASLPLASVIATLQDLSFVLDKADLDLGVVSATKLSGYQMRITVIVRPRGSSQLIVRANAQIDEHAVVDPKPYQDFFTALEKAMFLTAHEVD